MDLTTITHSTSGEQATLPAKFTSNTTQAGLDTLVFDAHHTEYPLSRAVCNAMGMRAVR